MSVSHSMTHPISPPTHSHPHKGCQRTPPTQLFRGCSRLAPSQCEISLQSNAISHWLGANLESAPLLLPAVLSTHPEWWSPHQCPAGGRLPCRPWCRGRCPGQWASWWMGCRCRPSGRRSRGTGSRRRCSSSGRVPHWTAADGTDDGSPGNGEKKGADQKGRLVFHQSQICF